MTRFLCKGNEAAVKGALLAGCESFYGYPITPASEIAEAAAALFPAAGGTFLQAESEIAAINLCYGAASAGERTMTASSSPGVSLMQEGLSYAAGAELPLVLVDVMRGGPGLGNIAPEQADYRQIVRGGGHGEYRLLTVAPASAQEMCDLTMLAFELADRYRNPACVLCDGAVAQMMEAVTLPEPVARGTIPWKPWAVRGTASTRENLVSSIYLAPDALEAHERALASKYEAAMREEVRYEEVSTHDADVVLVAYGICARIAESAVERARNAGLRAGLFRPISLWPFPARRLRELAASGKAFLVVELSLGQLVEDVRAAVGEDAQVALCARSGGNVPSEEEVEAAAAVLARGAAPPRALGRMR
jgi:pyruvate/2-oxoacid:ferredoxin oxidoreductase alpha subunit